MAALAWPVLTCNASLTMTSRCINLRAGHCGRFLGAVETAAELFIMMEYAEGGSLWDMLSRSDDLPFARRMEVALDAARGLHYLHTNKPAVLHRDIKGCAFFEHHVRAGTVAVSVITSPSPMALGTGPQTGRRFTPCTTTSEVRMVVSTGEQGPKPLSAHELDMLISGCRSNNVLIGAGGVAKLTDFGLSVIMENAANTISRVRGRQPPAHRALGGAGDPRRRRRRRKGRRLLLRHAALRDLLQSGAPRRPVLRLNSVGERSC